MTTIASLLMLVVGFFGIRSVLRHCGVSVCGIWALVGFAAFLLLWEMEQRPVGPPGQQTMRPEYATVHFIVKLLFCWGAASLLLWFKPKLNLPMVGPATGRTKPSGLRKKK